MNRREDFNLKQFDTSPSLTATLLGTDGKTPQDLTGATVRLSLKLTNGSGTLLGGPAVVVDAANGVVRYDWQAIDVAAAGHYQAEWVVTFPGPREMTWPNDGYLRIEIEPRIDPADSPPVPPPITVTVTADVTLDSINTSGQQLVNLDTTALATGTRAWVESVHANFYLEKMGTAFTPDNIQIVAGHNGGQWFRDGFTLPVTADPSLSPGLALPIGTRVHKADGSAAWDKFGTNATDWAAVASSAGGGFALVADLASTAHNKGASTIGIEDVGGYFPTKNTEAALQRLAFQVNAMPAATSDMFYKARAAAFLGTNKQSVWWMDFPEGSADMSIVLTSGGLLSTAVGDSADPVNSIGGIVDMSTGTSTSGQAQVLPVISTNFSPMAGFNSPHIRFYRACMFRMVSTPDANTIAFMGSQGHGMGVYGPGSATKYSVRVGSNAVGNQQYILSDETVDNKWVYLESLWDGT